MLGFQMLSAKQTAFRRIKKGEKIAQPKQVFLSGKNTANNNRVAHFEAVVDLDDWTEWAAGNGITPVLEGDAHIFTNRRIIDDR